MIIMQIGLVGMPGSGKTTLFNLITGNNHPVGLSGADEIYFGSAIVPDRRIDYLVSLYKPKKTTYARIDFKDIPGAKMDDSKARASRLLEEARSADALVQVLKVFQAENELITNEQAFPFKDLKNYETELLLADLDFLEKRITRLEGSPKNKKESALQIPVYKKLLGALDNEQPISSVHLTESERELFRGQAFLTEKPLFLVINLDEDKLRKGKYPDREKIASYTQAKEISSVEVSARIETEISRLEPEERLVFMDDLNLKESGLQRLARAAYQRLNLISFFTVGEDEVRAWTIQKGTSARQAAGKIHSDIERGFIRAEIFHYNQLHELGSTVKVREAGHFRLEGKDYLVHDGDIINFRFNV
jgi:ribosome-binding ATPase